MIKFTVLARIFLVLRLNARLIIMNALCSWGLTLNLFQLYERLNLADALVPRTYKDGQKIIHQGDAADGMYFVEEGNVRITMVTNGIEKEVRVVTCQ